MLDFPATARTVVRDGFCYEVWDEYPHRFENPDQVDNWDFWTVFETGGWEPYLEGVLDAHLGPTLTMLDVGAWWGPVTLIAAQKCAWVVAVEPDAVARKRLNANLRLAGQNANVYPVAVAAADGRVRIGHRHDRRFGDSMTSTIFDGDAVEVPAIALSTALAAASGNGHTIGMIKMDIEGGEEQVLPASKDVLRHYGAPLLLSTHAAIVDNPARYLRTVTSALADFDVTVVDGNLDGLATILAVPN